MTTATEIMMTARNANDAILRAENQDPDITQDWDDEVTLYRFEDNSVLAVSGSQVNAYADQEKAKRDYPNA
jgi:hypothetical protein